MNLFIEGYGSSTITESLCWLLRKFKGFKKLHVEPATEYPYTTRVWIRDISIEFMERFLSLIHI